MRDRVVGVCDKRATEALAADPGNPMTHYNLADTLTDMGRDVEAVRHWKAYLQVDSQSERAAYARRQIA